MIGGVPVRSSTDGIEVFDVKGKTVWDESDDNGSVTIFDKKSGDVVVDEKDAVDAGAVAMLAFDDVLYTRSSSSEHSRETITAHDMKDGFAGDTMAVSYFSSYSEDAGTETQLYDKDMKEMGDRLPGWYIAVDDKTFASVSTSGNTGSDLEVYDAEVSIVEAKDGRVSKLDSYPACPGCEIAGVNLARATENGYRLWQYRD